MYLCAILLALRKDESLSSSDQKYVQDLIEKYLDNKQSESHDDGILVLAYFGSDEDAGNNLKSYCFFRTILLEDVIVLL